MVDKNLKSSTHGGRRWPIALVATGLLVGGAGVGAVGVAAATAAPMLVSATATPSSSTDTESSHRSGETAVTGTKAATLKAAALKAVPGATVIRVETDADGATYEVHLTKSDGTRVTVKFDSALTQTAIQTGTGKGGAGHHRGNETAVTGTRAAALEAAALKAVPGASVVRVETDADGATYEVHLTKSDGTRVTVKFDSALTQTGIDTGH